MLAGAAVAAGVSVGLAFAGDDERASAHQLGDVRRSCQEWMGSVGPTGDPGWCISMTDWMSQQLGNGTMGPQMMWGDPTRLVQSCQRWMAADTPASALEPETWCDDMVAWMSEHSAGWSDWTTHGPMMSD